MPRCERLSTRRCGGWPARGRSGSVFVAGERARRARAVSRSGRAAAPGRLPDLRSGHPQHRLRRAEQARSRELYRRARAAGARENRRPVHLPGAGVVYVNDPDQFSVELLWMSRLGQALGLHAATGRQAAEGGHARDRADGADRGARDHVGCDRRPREHGQWIGLGSVRRTVDGAPDQMVAGPSGC